MPRRNVNTRGRSTARQPRTGREPRPWWTRSSSALHPKQLERLGWPEQEQAEGPEHRACPGCGGKLGGGYSYCSRECRMTAFELKDARCELCHQRCEVPVAVPDEEAKCSKCRERHRGYKKARVG